MEGLLQPIAERVLRPNMNLALVLATDRTTAEGEVKAWFFRVMRAVPLHLVYDSELSSIAPGANLTQNYIGVGGFGSGDDFLQVPDDYPFRVYHYAIGLKPSGIWLYRQYAGVLQKVLYPKVAQALGNKYDFIDGTLSPYDEPTVAAEDVIVKGVKVMYGFKNDAAFDIRPSIRLLGVGYDVLPITESACIDKLISGAIRCTYLTLGGFRTFTFTKPREWVEATVITQSKLLETMRK